MEKNTHNKIFINVKPFNHVFLEIWPTHLVIWVNIKIPAVIFFIDKLRKLMLKKDKDKIKIRCNWQFERSNLNKKLVAILVTPNYEIRHYFKQLYIWDDRVYYRQSYLSPMSSGWVKSSGVKRNQRGQVEVKQDILQSNKIEWGKATWLLRLL